MKPVSQQQAFDITDYVKPGQDNLIAVATDNAADRGQADSSKVTKRNKNREAHRVRQTVPVINGTQRTSTKFKAVLQVT